VSLLVDVGVDVRPLEHAADVTSEVIIDMGGRLDNQARHQEGAARDGLAHCQDAPGCKGALNCRVLAAASRVKPSDVIPLPRCFYGTVVVVRADPVDRVLAADAAE
jgi:hypothetical protein